MSVLAKVHGGHLAVPSPSKHQTIKASKHQSIKASKHQNIKTSKHQNIKTSKQKPITRPCMHVWSSMGTDVCSQLPSALDAGSYCVVVLSPESSCVPLHVCACMRTVCGSVGGGRGRGCGKKHAKNTAPTNDRCSYVPHEREGALLVPQCLFEDGWAVCVHA